MAFMLRDAEKVTSSSDRFVHQEEEILFAVLGSSNLMVRNRKVRGAERARIPQASRLI